MEQNGDYKAKEVRDKIQNTMIEKYGTIHPLQVDEFLVKSIETKCNNLNNPTSKPQLELYKRLIEIYGKCELEYPCGKCSLDCMLEINGVKIDVEYDGWFYHQDKNRDFRRNCFVKSQGYKILRIKSNKNSKEDIIPSKEQIINAIDYLLNNHSYKEIKM
jgi:Protein of unknown function (DUF559).